MIFWFQNKWDLCFKLLRQTFRTHCHWFQNKVEFLFQFSWTKFLITWSLHWFPLLTMRDLRAWIKFVLYLANQPGLACSWHWYFINLVIKATNYAWCWNHHDWQRQCQWLLAGQLRQVLLGDFWDGQQLSISLNHTSVSSSTHILVTTLIIFQCSFPRLDTPSFNCGKFWLA